MNPGRDLLDLGILVDELAHPLGLHRDRHSLPPLASSVGAMLLPAANVTNRTRARPDEGSALDVDAARLTSRSGPPSRPARDVREPRRGSRAAVSAGLIGADVETSTARNRSSCSCVMPSLRATARGAEPGRGDCRAPRRRRPPSQCGRQRRNVELLVVSQNDDRGVAVRLNPRKGRLRATRRRSRRRSAPARVSRRGPARRRRSCASRPLRGGAESFAGVDRADDDQAAAAARTPRRRPSAPSCSTRPLRRSSWASGARPPSGSSPITYHGREGRAPCARARCPQRRR